MKYLILGASAAGINAAREIRRLDKAAQIIVAAKEDFLYSRCIVHHYIKGIRDKSQMYFAGKDVISKYNIDFRKGYEAIGIDETKKEIYFKNNETITYDKLLIATGSSSYIPPVTGLREANQVVGLKDFEDAVYIKELIKSKKNIAIIGSGLIGMDALEGVIDSGSKIHLIDVADYLLPLQLDKHSAQVYMDKFKEYGVEGHFGLRAQEVHLDEQKNVKLLELTDGTKLEIDLIIVATGMRSNIKFLEGSSIKTNKLGLIFDQYGKTNVEDIFGAGDVSGVHPIWPMAVKEGIVAAHNMTGNKKVMDDMFASKTTMNFLKIPTMSLGEHTPKDNLEDYQILIDENSKHYKKVILKDGYVVGAILQGDLDYSGILTQIIKRKLKVSSFNKPIFEISYADFFDIDEKANFHFKQ